MSHVSSTIENVMHLSSGTLNLETEQRRLRVPESHYNFLLQLSTRQTERFHSRETQTVASANYYNLVIDPGAAKTASLNASTTAIGNVHINSNGTLAMGANNLTVLGNIRNTGSITVTTGNFIHTAESVLFTDSAGNESASYTNTATVCNCSRY